MFRAIKKESNALSNEQSLEILKNNNTAVLGLIGDDGYPYGVPIHYAYKNDMIYLHSSAKGHKLDSISNNPKACLTIIAKNDPIPNKFTTNYQSIIIFGKATVQTEEQDKKEGLLALVEHISSDFIPEGVSTIEKYINDAVVIKFKIEHLTGKANQVD